MKKTALALAALVLLSASVQSANASCKFCQKLKFWDKKAETTVVAPAKKVEAKSTCPCAKPAVKAPVAPAKPACPCAKPAVKAPIKK